MNTKDQILTNELLKAVKERLLEDRKLVNILMDTLSMGKEAVYRRIRGEVPFTFYEAVRIAKEMGLSLDEIAGNSVTNVAMFALNPKHNDNPFDYIYKTCQSYYDICTYMQGDPNAVLSSATNIIPFIFLSNHKALIRYRLYRWIHQHYGTKWIEELKDDSFINKIIDILESIHELLDNIPLNYILWDKNVFSSVYSDIRYFKDLNLIQPDELKALKRDCLSFLEEMEDIACKGKNSKGSTVYIYISSLDFEASYTYMEKKDFQLSFLHLYAIDYIHSQHPDICNEHKQWIDSLKRYSTLISQCGEKQRLQFFNTQRESVLNL